MAQSIKYALLQQPTTSKPAVPPRTSSGSVARVQPISIGTGLTLPFRRDGKGDFAHASDLSLIQSSVRQVLSTVRSSPSTRGELPWRPEFGSVLEALRHRNLDDVTAELARTRVVESLRAWLPRVRVKRAKVTLDHDESTLTLALVYDVLSLSRRSVLASNLSDSVTLVVGA